MTDETAPMRSVNLAQVAQAAAEALFGRRWRVGDADHSAMNIRHAAFLVPADAGKGTGGAQSSILPPPHSESNRGARHGVRGLSGKYFYRFYFVISRLFISRL